jgi:Holliday junction resolvase RusA-like endonuclease
VTQFVVPGRPRGKDRPRFVRATGRTYTPTQTRTAEDRVVGAWERAGSVRFDGPVTIRVEVVIARPGSHFRTNGALSKAGLAATWPTRKPDLDNHLKLVADALNGCAYKDDAQIVRAFVVRRWTNPGEGEHTDVSLDAAPVPELVSEVAGTSSTQGALR